MSMSLKKIEEKTGCLKYFAVCKSSCKLNLPQDLALLVAADVEGGGGWLRQVRGRQTWKPATQPEEMFSKKW